MVAAADIPGIDAFGLVTSGQSFVPSVATEQIITDQVDLLVEEYGDKGREIIADAQAEGRRDERTGRRRGPTSRRPPSTTSSW